MTDILIRQLSVEHVNGKPLGRHVEHDPRSKAFDVDQLLTAEHQAAPLRTVLHHRLCPPFDQGNLGSCTGNAMAGALMTEPLHKAGVMLSEVDAVSIYEQATKLDGVPGAYPPDDTGSSGLAVAKASKARGLLSSYHHAFSLRSALKALQVRPAIAGVAWFDSFDNPGQHGLISISPGAHVRGGHEIELVGLDVDAKTIRACNSWGASWGDGGFFTISWDDFDQLLHDQGDVVVPVA